ncbi:TIM barrel protein [Eubacteriales bacterium OttesenSCG-928-K08]|nr:TIM barrel protein [Eubacteriales bacterium OttesenSCG-928-K08]
MKYSLCIEPMFENVDFYDRIRLAKDCGADAVEFWDPADYDTRKIGAILEKENMPIAICCLNKAWSIRSNAPYAEFKKNVEKTIAFGKDMGCNNFIALSGELECKADTQKSILIENFKRIAELCEREGVVLSIEALNSLYDHKGYYLDSSYIGFEICKAVNSPSIKLLYDCYHMQLMEGNLTNSITTNIGFIGHFHSAGVPGRHELHLGEINYTHIIRAAEEAGYTGYFGLEYWPTYDNMQSLKDVLRYVRDAK